MVRVAHLAAALGIFSIGLGAQDDPLAWFPLRPGSRWVYEYEAKSGDPRKPNVERWATQETITGWIAIPEGIVVAREVKRLGKASESRTGRVLGLDGQVSDAQAGANGGYLLTREREPYLIRENCVYVMDSGYDARSRQLRPEYRKFLAEGVLSPDFCFPLETGRRWGNMDIPWRVEPASSGARSFLPAEYPNAIHIFSDHFGSGGLKDVWFQKGVGVVAERYWHKGTYDEYSKRLVSRSDLQP